MTPRPRRWVRMLFPMQLPAPDLKAAKSRTLSLAQPFSKVQQAEILRAKLPFAQDFRLAYRGSRWIANVLAAWWQSLRLRSRSSLTGWILSSVVDWKASRWSRTSIGTLIAQLTRGSRNTNRRFICLCWKRPRPSRRAMASVAKHRMNMRCNHKCEPLPRKRPENWTTRSCRCAPP